MVRKMKYIKPLMERDEGEILIKDKETNEIKRKRFFLKDDVVECLIEFKKKLKSAFIIISKSKNSPNIVEYGKRKDMPVLWKFIDECFGKIK